MIYFLILLSYKITGDKICLFIYLDESGDLGFDWDKKATSKYFTVTILICYNKEVNDRIKSAVQKTLKLKLNHKKSKRINKEIKGT